MLWFQGESKMLHFFFCWCLLVLDERIEMTVENGYVGGVRVSVPRESDLASAIVLVAWFFICPAISANQFTLLS